MVEITIDCTLEDIYKVAKKLYDTGSFEFEPQSQQEVLKQIRQAFEEKVSGLDDVKEAFLLMTEMAHAGLSEPGKPRGRFLFMGLPGLGKTMVPQVYAEAMKVPFERINMAEYVGRVPNDLLIKIAAGIRKNPSVVFLFDEIEKAPLETQNILLEIM